MPLTWFSDGFCLGSAMRANHAVATTLSALLAAAVLGIGCTADTEASTGQASTRSDPSTVDAESAADSETAAENEPDEVTTTVVQNLAVIYRASEGVWPGFVLADHPAVIILRDGSDSSNLLALNHPDPDALGAAKEIKSNDLPFTAHTITDPSDAERLDAVVNFEFNITLGGVDSFAIAADSSDEIMSPTSPEFPATFVHEIFHRYQVEAFDEGEFFQDVEGYPYEAENLELAVLEERALLQALTAATDEDRKAAARRFAGIRLARRAAEPAVAELDDGQELAEGTARYIEHQVNSEESGGSYHGKNYDRDLIVDLGGLQGGIKESFGFGRFYASGAAIIRVIDELGVDDYHARLESGQPPATILVDALGVTDADADLLVDEARAEYDPLGELPKQANAAAEKAGDEPPVFGDEPSVGSDDGTLTAEQIDCLDDRGIDIDDGGGATLSNEDATACLD